MGVEYGAFVFAVQRGEEYGAMMLFFISEKYIHVFLVVSRVFGVI
jgi:hypothetical protein